MILLPRAASILALDCVERFADETHSCAHDLSSLLQMTMLQVLLKAVDGGYGLRLIRYDHDKEKLLKTFCEQIAWLEPLVKEITCSRKVLPPFPSNKAVEIGQLLRFTKHTYGSPSTLYKTALLTWPSRCVCRLLFPLFFHNPIDKCPISCQQAYHDRSPKHLQQDKVWFWCDVWSGRNQQVDDELWCFDIELLPLHAFHQRLCNLHKQRHTLAGRSRLCNSADIGCRNTA